MRSVAITSPYQHRLKIDCCSHRGRGLHAALHVARVGCREHGSPQARWMAYSCSEPRAPSPEPRAPSGPRVPGPRPRGPLADTRCVRAIHMKRAVLRFGQGFRVVDGNRRSQAATMTLAAGDSEGGPDNRHRGADQWLFVQSGTGLAIVNGHRTKLRAGSLVLIERGDRHEIRNTGRAP